jgi:hypothetical protein
LAIAPGGDWLASLPELDALDRFVASLGHRSQSERLIALPRLMSVLRRPGVVAEALSELDRRRDRDDEGLLEALKDATNAMPGLLERWEGQAKHLGLEWGTFEALRGEAQRMLAPEVPALGPDNRLTELPLQQLSRRFELEAIRVGAGVPKLRMMLEDLQREQLASVPSALKRYELKVRADPAWSLHLLEELAAEVLAVDARGRRTPRVLGLGGALDRVVAGQPPSGSTLEILDRAWAGVRDLADELRLLVTTTRSRLLLVKRFATWASWYERDRLRQLIEAESRSAGVGGVPKPRQIEARLTEELQAFLFAAGLTPLSKPMIGRLEPDLFASLVGEQPLYVEAKQHSATTGEAIVKVVAQGFRQVIDSATELAGTSHRLTEAFVVVFGMSGPAVDCPTPISYMGVRVHVVFVDLAAWEARGSRGRQKPFRFDEGALLTELASVDTSAEADGGDPPEVRW